MHEFYPIIIILTSISTYFYHLSINLFISIIILDYANSYSILSIVINLQYNLLFNEVMYIIIILSFIMTQIIDLKNEEIMLLYLLELELFVSSYVDLMMESISMMNVL